jgi:hypothetical protein
MASNLGRYLRDLAANPARVRELQADPDAAMDRAGLSSQEKQILRRRNRAEITEYLQREDPHIV